ncbi:MAG: hypothetical protein ACJAXN_002641, partial [Psychromonas sp.]
LGLNIISAKYNYARLSSVLIVIGIELLVRRVRSAQRLSLLVMPKMHPTGNFIQPLSPRCFVGDLKVRYLGVFRL